MDNSKQISELEEKVARLKREQEEYNRLSEDKKLAELIHTKLCRYNHVDGCGWHYESWKQPLGARTEYLKKAQNILKLSKFKEAVKIIEQL